MATLFGAFLWRSGGFGNLQRTADLHEVRDMMEVRVRESTTHSVTLLFDPEHNLEERILNEQFVS